jgi:DtxR family Mn-dependent transcriptional regulator
VDDAHAPLRVRKEHYLEVIYSLGDGVTLSRLARALSVKPSSALMVVRELEAEGLVTYNGREGLRLTKAGWRRAEELNQRHKTLEEFFLLIGLTPEETFREAEKLEHVISPEVVRRVAKLNEALKKMRGF